MEPFGTLTLSMFVVCTRAGSRRSRRVTLDRQYGISRDESIAYLEQFTENNPDLAQRIEAEYTTRDLIR